MEKYFDIRYEFDVPTIHSSIEKQLATGRPGYNCVADGYTTRKQRKDSPDMVSARTE